MKTRTPIAANQFTVPILSPSATANAPCVNIYADGKFNMNGSLTKKLGGKTLQIAFTNDARHFMMLENSDAEYSIVFPKSGSRKLPDVVSLLQQQKITLPARYDVWYNESGKFWQGDLEENPMIRRSAKRPSLKQN